jgi:hypothetical protein
LNAHSNQGGYSAGGGAVGIYGVTGTQGNGQANTVYGGAPSGAGCGGVHVPNQGMSNAGGSGISGTGNTITWQAINPGSPINTGTFGSIFPAAGRGATVLFGGLGSSNFYAGINNIIGSTPPEPGGGGAGLPSHSRINYRKGGMFAGGGGVTWGNFTGTAASAGDGGDCGGGGGGGAGRTGGCSITGSIGGIGAVIIEIMSPSF